MTHCIAAREVMQLFILKPWLQSSFPPAGADQNCPQEACDKLPSSSYVECCTCPPAPRDMRNSPLFPTIPLVRRAGNISVQFPGVLSKQHGKNSGGWNSRRMNCTHCLFAHAVCIVSVPDSLKELCKSCNTQTQHNFPQCNSSFCRPVLYIYTLEYILQENTLSVFLLLI